MKNIILLSILTLLLGACRQSPEDQPDQTALLTAPRWELTAYDYRFEPYADSSVHCASLAYEQTSGELHAYRCSPFVTYDTVAGYRLQLRFSVDANGQGQYEVEEATAFLYEGGYEYCDAREFETGTWLYGQDAERLIMYLGEGWSVGTSADLYFGANMRAGPEATPVPEQAYQLTELTADRLVLEARNANELGAYNIRAVFSPANTNLCE